MVVLDSSFVIDVLRNYKPALELLEQIERHETIFVTAITIMELWEGALKDKMPEHEKKVVEDFLGATNILNFDMRAAKRTAEINHELSRTPIEPEDAMIAGITFVQGETLVTRDQDFAMIPGLKVLKY